MVEKLGKSVLELSTEDKGLDKGIKSAKQKAEALGASFVKAGAVVTAIGVPFALAAKSAIDTADNFAKTSKKIGVSVETLSAFSFAARSSGSCF